MKAISREEGNGRIEAGIDCRIERTHRLAVTTEYSVAISNVENQ